MKNTINYYYNIRIDDLIKQDNNYYFYYNNDKYKLIIYDRPIEDLNALYKLNMNMIKRRCKVHQIIINKDKSIVTIINNEPYILLKLCNDNDQIYLNDINYIQHMTYNIEYDKSLLRTNWVNLWCEKIDYYEYQISQLGKEYPILCDSLSYFIGLGENAISYLVNNIKENKKILVVSHKRINNDFYNPLNFIIDDRVRDVSEYIKNTFFNNRFNINELRMYLDNNNLSYEEYISLYSRLLFPTYYFDIYEDIIIGTKKEKELNLILSKKDNVLKLLKYI